MPRPTRPAAPPKPRQSSVRKPTNGAGRNGAGNNDEVARRAYEIYESRGGVHGSDLDDWLEAERELKSGPKSVTGPIATAKSKKAKKTPEAGV